jgi:predicted aspartyl protease
MENGTMGRVLTEAKIENLQDLWDIRLGLLPADKARAIEVKDALVDTGATPLALPTRYIKQLGLEKAYEKRGISSKGEAPIDVYQAVRLTMHDGRYCTVDVMEVPDGVPVLIGQIPLEMLDLVVDLRNRKVTGNPAHGGEHVLELY